MGLRQLQFIHSAPEATFGTTVATATAKWTGLYTVRFHQEETKIRPDELRQSLARYFRTVNAGRLGRVEVEMTCTFEDIIFVLMAGIRATTPTADMGMPAAYTWTFSPTLTTVDNPKTYTLQVGDDTQAYLQPYSFCTNFELSFAVAELTRLRASFVGREQVAGAATSGLAERITEDVLGQKWVVKIGDAGMGVDPSTVAQYTGCVLNGTWRLPQTYTPHRCIDGQLTFTRHQQMPLAPEMDLTVELDATSSAFRSKYINATRQIVRLENVGSQIHGGMPAVNKLMHLDGAFQLTDWGEVGGSDQDGVNTLRLAYVGEFDPDWGKLFEITVINGNDATPLYA
jgi:hypothetical protein